MARQRSTWLEPGNLLMSAQGSQYHGTRKKSGEEGRWRENTVGVTPLPTRGTMLTKPLPGGRSLEPRVRRVATTTHPFKVTKSGSGSGTRIRVEPGTYNGQIPTMDDIPLDEEPTTELDDGTQYVWLKATYLIQTANNYVYAGTLESIAVEITDEMEDVPLGPKGPGESVDFFILLASFEDRAKTGQYIITSLGGELCGIVDDSGMVNLLVFTS